MANETHSNSLDVRGNVDHENVQKTQLIIQDRKLNAMNIANIIPCMGMTADEVKANAERIVECVNAMAGISSPKAFMEKFKQMEDELADAQSHARVMEEKYKKLLSDYMRRWGQSDSMEELIAFLSKREEQGGGDSNA